MGGMEVVEPLIAWLREHLFAAVLITSFIDATGLPCPGRAILVIAGVAAVDGGQLVLVILTSALGALLGDHVLYYFGTRGGMRLLALYCRLSLGSARCVENTLDYFRRFGAMAVLFARFSTGVRLFAAVLAGSGQLGYARFLALDVIGTLGYATLWSVLGFAFGAAVLDRAGGYTAALALLIPTALAAVVAYRVYRRRRYGPASGDLLPRR